MGAARKVVIFTESRRTQDYGARFLEAHDYAGRVVTFSGTNNTQSAAGVLYAGFRQATAVATA